MSIEDIKVFFTHKKIFTIKVTSYTPEVEMIFKKFNVDSKEMKNCSYGVIINFGW